jgi:hypothetical protein
MKLNLQVFTIGSRYHDSSNLCTYLPDVRDLGK